MKVKSIIYIFTSLALVVSFILLFNYFCLSKSTNSISKNKEVTEIQIGETYTMSWSKSDVRESDRSIPYIKLLDDKTFMEVYDGTQRSKEYYEGDGDRKNIKLIIGTYEKEGDNFIQKSYISYQILSFSPDIDVKKGASGEIGDFMSPEKREFDSSKGGGTAIEKYGEHYRLNYANLKGISSDALRVSKIKLPGTVEEYLSQYNLIPEKK